jgi:uncharacterized OB-fold protein
MSMTGLIDFELQLMRIYPDVWTKPFWDAAREHRLVAQRCTSCGTFRMPPTAICWNCHSREMEYADLPGTGTVYTFTVARHALIPEVRAALPYVIATIALDGAPGARLISNVIGVDPDAVRIGMPVEVVFDDISPEQTMPRFRPAPEKG